MARQWRDIALIMRDRQYSEDEDLEIDIFDVQCKHWGIVLRHLFGVSLGTGDYGHLTIEHAPMLMRRFRSMTRYSNQGFEAAHKLQRQLYSRATNHDCLKPASSLEDMLVHSYAERLLAVRYSFRQAKESIISGKPFYYRGCGWRRKTVPWSNEDKEWIESINNLLDMMLGPDHLEFEQTPDTKYCIVSPHSVPEYEYDHQKWEDEFTLGQKSQSPCKTSETPGEPPRKLPKLSSKPPVKRELNLKPKAGLQDTSVIKKFINLPTCNPIRVPCVPAWGGTFGSITLVNTCPIDNFLTIVYFHLKDVPQISKKLSELSEPWAKDLVSMESFFDKKEFTQGKIEWLRYFSQFDFSVASGTFDIWGNEFDLFWKRCDSLLQNAAQSTCSSEQCPKKKETMTATGINIMEVASQKMSETYLEAALREWLLPAPSQCGKLFSKPPPSTADAILGPQTLDLTTVSLINPTFVMGYVPIPREHSVTKRPLPYQFLCITLLPMV
ncbi:hypothetical protein OS493_030733 [Desmophyllum pertusum]|uniref:Uncharacterized protein n=1 Tax=Desmophyllum pertusum TaxID=174260 RepID=A0A9W9ZAJ6_9CNID|nr:hypothetical protein OS493_030733 [Desmophyllum pertusum]